MKFLFLLFLVVPLVEIYLLIKIGSVVGAGMTIFLVVFTAFLGAVLVRAQGFSTLARMQGQMDTGQLPALEIMEGVMLFVAGALLLTPGFFTDAVGFVFLTPPLRRVIIRWIIEHKFIGPANVHGPGASPGTGSRRVIDAEYRNID
jgi:UPF0716 protein FxsA